MITMKYYINEILFYVFVFLTLLFAPFIIIAYYIYTRK